ncbi:MAG: hypothetical protein HC830_02320 [Bacteroidetes bacterium]|nr:hypothetical protein [Bacteroidales bacterium]NJO68247.1 hypothetical protein [Bacteroidota bacterium]
MKKVVFMISILGMLLLGAVNTVLAQDEMSERKDTISVDNSDPVFYDAEEDAETKSSGNGLIIGIVAGVVVAGVVVVLLKKKKK